MNESIRRINRTLSLRHRRRIQKMHDTLTKRGADVSTPKAFLSAARAHEIHEKRTFTDAYSAFRSAFNGSLHTEFFVFNR